MDIEAAIFRQIKEQVLQSTDSLIAAANIVAEIDALFSLFLAAREHFLVKP